MKNKKVTRMRKNLKQDYATSKKTNKYIGRFSKVGYRHTNGNINPTLCLYAITDEFGNPIADHMWFNYSSAFRKLGELRYGDVIAFEAKTTKYTKGHGYNKQDYKLTQPSKVVLINSQHSYVPLPASKDLMIGYVLIKNQIKLRYEKTDYRGKYSQWAKSEYEKMVKDLTRDK